MQAYQFKTVQEFKKETSIFEIQLMAKNYFKNCYFGRAKILQATRDQENTFQIGY